MTLSIGCEGMNPKQTNANQSVSPNTIGKFHSIAATFSLLIFFTYFDLAADPIGTLKIHEDANEVGTVTRWDVIQPDILLRANTQGIEDTLTVTSSLNSANPVAYQQTLYRIFTVNNTRAQRAALVASLGYSLTQFYSEPGDNSPEEPFESFRLQWQIELMNTPGQPGRANLYNGSNPDQGWHAWGTGVAYSLNVIISSAAEGTHVPDYASPLLELVSICVGFCVSSKLFNRR